MGRKKEFKVAKSFTITVKNIAWLEEQCYKTDEKASVILERLITNARVKERKKRDNNKWYCTECEADQTIIVKGFTDPKFFCSVCVTNLTQDINKYRDMQ